MLLFNVFDKHREKYAKPDFMKFISLEISCFVGIVFVFKVTKASFPTPLFLSTFLSPFAKPDSYY